MRKRIALMAGAALLVAAALPLLTTAQANAPMQDPLFLKECGACHMAYPAQLLPARSWQAITDHLDDHFGEDATLEPALKQRIQDYLVSRASDAYTKKVPPAAGAGEPPPVLRITEQPWWIAKHEARGRVTPQKLARHGAKSKADCQACHTGAVNGVFEDD